MCISCGYKVFKCLFDVKKYNKSSKTGIFTNNKLSTVLYIIIIDM